MTSDSPSADELEDMDIVHRGFFRHIYEDGQAHPDPDVERFKESVDGLENILWDEFGPYIRTPMKKVEDTFFHKAEDDDD